MMMRNPSEKYRPFPQVRLTGRRWHLPRRTIGSTQGVAQDGLCWLEVRRHSGHAKQVGHGGRSDPASAPCVIKKREVLRRAIPEAFGKDVPHLTHQGVECNGSCLELAIGLQQHRVERRMLPADQVGQPLGFVSGRRGGGHAYDSFCISDACQDDVVASSEVGFFVSQERE